MSTRGKLPPSSQRWDFYSKTIWISKAVLLGKADYNDPEFSGHYKEFRAGYWTWYQNKTFGSGIKSFKTACPKIVPAPVINTFKKIQLIK